MIDLIDRTELLRIIQNGQRYNSKCPEWIINVIKKSSPEKENKMSITNPTYYKTSKIEPIDVIEDWGLNFSLGSVIKYVKRAGDKPNNPTIDDLKKAKWYLEREIKRHNKERNDENDENN